MTGVHLSRTTGNAAAIDALVSSLAPAGGGRVPLARLLGDLDRRGRRAPLGRVLGRKVRRSLTFDAADRHDERWWPQGITSSADASDREDGTVEGRRLLVVSWYAKDREDGHHGSRLTFLDLDTLRYRHVLLVAPEVGPAGVTLAPLKVHAGGIVWRGGYLHVAATARGLLSFRVEDLIRMPSAEQAPFGYRYVLPARFTHGAAAEEGVERLRYSFLSLDRSSEPPGLLAGEYGRGGQTRRFAHYPLDPGTSLPAVDEEGTARPTSLADAGLAGMQGAVTAAGSYHVTVSHGPWKPGSLYVGRPGAFRRHRRAVPMGPEDTTYWPGEDLLWTVTEHPRRRWLVAVPRASLS